MSALWLWTSVAVGLAALLAGCGGRISGETGAGDEDATEVDTSNPGSSASRVDGSFASGVPEAPETGSPDVYERPDAADAESSSQPLCGLDAGCAFPESWCWNGTCVAWSSDWGLRESDIDRGPQMIFQCEDSNDLALDDSIYCPGNCCVSEAARGADGDWESYAFLGDDGAWETEHSLFQNFVARSSAPIWRFKVDIHGGYEYGAFCFDEAAGAWTNEPFVMFGQYGVDNEVDQPGAGIFAAPVPATCVGAGGAVRIQSKLRGMEAGSAMDEIKYYEGVLGL